jgi:hypothetical protein
MHEFGGGRGIHMVVKSLLIHQKYFESIYDYLAEGRRFECFYF